MSKITVRGLEEQSALRALEEERARRMRLIFEATDSLGDLVALQARRRAGARAARPVRRFPWGIALGLTLASGGALALEVSGASLREVWSTLSPGLDSSGNQRKNGRTLTPKSGEERGAAVGRAAEPAREEAPRGAQPPRGAQSKSMSARPEALGTKMRGASAQTSGSKAPETKGLPSRGSLPVEDSPEPIKNEAIVRGERWNRVAEALSQNDLESAARETDSLSTADDPATRDAARLVRAQLEIKREGQLSASTRETLKELSARAVSANVRREAARILRESER